MSFTTLGLADSLARAVADQGYAEPTPIQLQAIPLALAGRDLLAAAQTGAGKTAAFTLPLLQRLNAAGPQTRRRIRALVLTPTRELAAQVGASIRGYGRHLPLRAAVIFGGVNIKPQIDLLRRGVDILIATPGRLLDHVGQKTLDLGGVDILVLDEADRMLDMGFMPDIRRILALLPKQRQTLLFSATFSDEIRALAAGLLRDPVRLDAALRANAPPAQISQQVHPVDRNRKQALLAHLVTAGDWRQTLVFTRTKHGANRLAQQLERDGISAAAIHGNKSQAARTRALADFKQGKVRVLVATDLASRGLDIAQLPQVVNYELPAAPEDYVHRIGRTGRAGRAGAAVSLVSGEEAPYLKGIQRLLGHAIPAVVVDGFAPTAEVSRETDDQPRSPSQPRRARPPEHRPRTGATPRRSAPAPRHRAY